MPAVSKKIIWAVLVVSMPRTTPRVVCGLGVTIESFEPTMRFISVDLPTLGSPASAIYPALKPAVSVMAFTLNGLAIGLGALYPNFKEENPSKIVSGFGGTFCLVLSFLYIVASVVLLAIGSPWTRYGEQESQITIFAWLALGALSLGIGWIPLRLGLRRVRAFEC